MKLPRGFPKRVSLKLLVLPTKIPVTCVGVLTNLGVALKFSLVPLHGFVAGQRGSLGRNVPSAESPTMAPPGPQAASEPTSSLRSGECPPWLLPLDAHVAGWRHGPLFPRCPCPRHCPRGHWRYGSRFMRAHPCPLRYPGPSWALGLPRPTSPVPGVPTKRYSPFAATLPAHQQDSCTPPNGFRAYIRTNSKTTSILSIWLTHDLTLL